MSKIKEMPLSERPREKAIIYGIESLSNEELIALLLSSGTKGYSALDISRVMLSSTSSLKELANSSFQDLKSFKGVSVARALVLCSSFELARRIGNTENEILTYYNCNADVARYFTERMENITSERVYIVLLNNINKLIAIRNIYIGTRTNVTFEPKEVLKIIAKFEAKKFYLVHNHPSDNVVPSSYDVKLTRLLKAYASTIDVKLEDHLIIGRKKFYSIEEEREHDL